ELAAFPRPTEISETLYVHEEDKVHDECGVFAMYAPDDYQVGTVAPLSSKFCSHEFPRLV
ncbi:MAG: hypothetical protein JWM99_2010, partial [Verrucomicrobiales bacterium]|nr:hypothetical protein [Verrucomicrobiales bacterium]